MQSLTINNQAFVGIAKTLAAFNRCVVYPSRITWRSLTLFPMTISLLSSAYQQTLSVPRRELSAHRWVLRTINVAASCTCSTCLVLCFDAVWKTVFGHIFRHREQRENTTRCGVFLTNSKVFGNVVKHGLGCLIYLLNLILNKGENGEINA